MIKRLTRFKYNKKNHQGTKKNIQIYFIRFFPTINSKIYKMKKIMKQLKQKID